MSYLDFTLVYSSLIIKKFKGNFKKVKNEFPLRDRKSMMTALLSFETICLSITRV